MKNVAYSNENYSNSNMTICLDWRNDSKRRNGRSDWIARSTQSSGTIETLPLVVMEEIEIEIVTVRTTVIVTALPRTTIALRLVENLQNVVTKLELSTNTIVLVVPRLPVPELPLLPPPAPAKTDSAPPPQPPSAPPPTSAPPSTCSSFDSRSQIHVPYRTTSFHSC